MLTTNQHHAALRVMPAKKNQPFVIVLRLPNWVGDVCMSLPCVQWLADSGHEMVIYGRPWAQPLMAQFQPRAFVALSGRFSEDLQTVKQARLSQSGESRGLILPDSLSSAAIFRLAGVPSLGYRHDGRSLLLRWPVGKPSPQWHASHKWWHLIKQAAQQWQLPPPDSEPPGVLLKPAQHDEQAATDLMRAEGLTPGHFVLVAPTATGLHKGQVKVWPHFEALTQSLQAAGHRVIACPPASEQEQVRLTTPSAQRVGPLSLTGLAALAKQASLVLCNDSGVSHLAATVRARQITLFGVTDPKITAPLSTDATVLGSLGHWPDLNTVLDAALDRLTRPSPSKQLAHEQPT